jgi:NAD(P)-dependent dehydrogenase (short-subunit alcohol dehydrogenase family)
MDQQRRVSLIAGAGFYVGPDLARLLAARGHDLVLGDPSESLVDELESSGAQVEVVTGVRDLTDPAASHRLVAAGISRFGRIDSASAFTGLIVTGRFMAASLADLESVFQGCMVAPFHFLQAVLAPMIEQGDGQVLVITSASAARPTPEAPLYSSARAGATMMVRNAANEVARHGVQVNAVGTNYMDFPEFRRASGANDPEIMAKIIRKVPLGRLGTMAEFAAFCGPYVDGTSRFTTGQFTSYAGGWA